MRQRLGDASSRKRGSQVGGVIGAKKGEKRPGGFRLGEGRKEGRKVAAEPEPLPRSLAAPRLPPDARVLLCSGGLGRGGGCCWILPREEKSAGAAKMPLKTRGFEGPMSQWRPPQRFSSPGWML